MALRARQLVAAFPDRFALGIEAAQKVTLPRRAYQRVVACGMGGSALASDLVNTYFDINPDIVVHRNYGLPNEAISKSLAIVTSHSGNTEESLSAFEAARAVRSSVIAITTGGTLAQQAKKFKIPLVLLPNDGPPRYSVAEQIGALFDVLARSGVIEDENTGLIAAAAEIAQDVDIEKTAAIIASACVERIPIMYAEAGFEAIARVWKIKFNESAKMAAFYNVLPEANHNELEALRTGADRFCYVLLEDQSAAPRMQKRFALVADLAKKAGARVVRVPMRGANRLEKILHTVWLGDWVSLLAAEKLGVDPLGIPTIEDFKSRL